MKKRHSRKHRKTSSNPSRQSLLPSTGPAANGASFKPAEAFVSAPVPAAAARERKATGIDPWRLVSALARGWPGWLAAGLVCGVAGFFIAAGRSDCVATARLVHNQTPGLLNASLVSETFRPRETSPDTLLEAVKSPSILQRVAAAVDPPLGLEEVRQRFIGSPVARGEFLELRFRGRNSKQAVRAVNLLAEETANASRRLQADEFQDLNQSLQSRLTRLDVDLVRAGQELVEFQRANGSIDFDRETAGALRQREDLEVKEQDLKLALEATEQQLKNLTDEMARQNPTLVAAKNALSKALERYTDDHPRVLQLRAAVAAAEGEAAARGTQAEADALSWGSPAVTVLYQQSVELRTKRIGLTGQLQALETTRKKLDSDLQSLPEKQLACAKIKSRYESLKAQRERLAGYQRDGQLLADNSLGYYRIYQVADAGSVVPFYRQQGGWWIGVLAGLAGAALAGLLIAGRELADGRIRSEADLKRVTRLPLLATLGDCSAMTDREKEAWAFRTLKLLRGKLNEKNSQALVCGFTSATSGEGRSTWVRLLAAAAGKEGLRVLVISSDPGGHVRAEEIAGAPKSGPGTAHSGEPTGPAVSESGLLPQPAQPTACFALEKWIWNPDRRQQWQALLRQWSELENVAVLVELPPASTPEAILLAENLPKVIWLCSKDMATASETRSQLETLRCARCNLAGVVFNRATVSRWKRQFGHWIGGAVVSLGLLHNTIAAEPTTNAFAPSSNALNPRASLTISTPDQLADWQKHLTLGPSDLLEISIYEEPDSARTGLSIGPDGRLNYLEARDVEASGLTIDELRKKLAEALGKGRTVPPTVIIRPQAYNSKKYFMLGNVAGVGVYPLNRPVTIVEAIARAGGFVTSVEYRNALVQADLTRSFLVRSEPDGSFKRVPVDFEALFQQGDLSQNLGLAPGDYLYFPPLDQQQIYVLGQVGSPGTTPYTKTTTLVGAIISRGGFSSRAYKGKVLVIRGSLKSPETFLVDANAILTARAKDFRLENRDIVWVSERPFARAEEVLEMALTTFANSFVIGVAGLHVNPIITQPWVR